MSTIQIFLFLAFATILVNAASLQPRSAKKKVIIAAEETLKVTRDVEIIDSNLPEADQRELVAAVQEIYNKIHDPQGRADALYKKLSEMYSDYNNLVIINFDVAVLYINYYLDLFYKGDIITMSGIPK